MNTAFGKRYKSCPTIQWKEARGHKTYLEYREIFRNRGQDIHDYILFTVVRNPWDWHLSWYNYVSTDLGAKKSGMLVEHEQIKDMTFSDYLKWLNDRTLPRSQDDYMRRQMSDWLVNEKEALAVSHILRQERLEPDLLSLQQEFGLKLDVQFGERINASRLDSDYRRAYSSVEAEMIAKRHTRDIALFGYKFD